MTYLRRKKDHDAFVREMEEFECIMEQNQAEILVYGRKIQGD